MKTNFFKTIFTLAILAGFVACSNDDDEDIITIVGRKGYPATWVSETATGTIEFGTAENEKAYARFVNGKMAAQPANVLKLMYLDFHDDGTFFLSGNANRFGTGRYEVDAKALKDCKTLTLIGFSENQDRINLPIKLGEDGLEMDITNWDIVEHIAKIVAYDYRVDFANDTGYDLEFKTMPELNAWVNSLKITKVSLKIMFQATQRR
jgi:hypothetical protein